MNLMKMSLMGLCLVAGMTAWAQNDAGLQDLADLLGGGRPTNSVAVAEEAPVSAPAQTTPTQEVTQSRAKSERFSVGASSGGSVGAGLPANMAVGATRTKTATPRKPAGDPNIREVIGKGYGATRQEALTNACRDAIEFAVGLFVDSETLVDNFELKKDEILTQSNGYIAPDGIKIMWEGPTSRGHCIQIKAKVKMQEVTHSLRDIAPVSTSDASPLAGVLATATSKQSRDERAAALIARELDGFDPVRQLYAIRLVNEAGTQNPTLVTDKNGDPKIENGLYTVRYLYEIYPLTDVYFDVFVPRFDQLLSQISLRRPRTIFMRAKRRTINSDRVNEVQGYGYSVGNFPGNIRQKSYYEIGYKNEEKINGKIRGKQNEGVVLSIVTMMNPSLSAITAKDYFLAPKVVETYTAWEDAYYGTRCVEYFLQVQDSQGNILAQSAFSVPTNEILYKSTMKSSPSWYCAERVEWMPLVRSYESSSGHSYSTTLRSYVDVQLSEEDMANARNVSVGLMEWAQ